MIMEGLSDSESEGSVGKIQGVRPKVQSAISEDEGPGEHCMH